jgi:hypothetical protein
MTQVEINYLNTIPKAKTVTVEPFNLATKSIAIF